MLGYFPTPYKDEDVFSIFARYHKLSGNSCLSQTRYDLFGVMYGTVSNFPHKLNYLHRELNYDKMITPEYLVYKHTILPLYQYFLYKDCEDKIIEEIKIGSTNKISQMLGEVSGDINKNRYVKFCPKCFKDSLDLNGEFYINRIHQFPGNQVCHIHKISLKGIFNNESISSRLKILYEKNIIIDYETNNIDNTLLSYFYNLSLDIAYFFNVNNENLNLDKIHDIYRKKLEDSGFLYKNGAVKHTKLQKSFLEYYPDKFLGMLNCNVDFNKNNNWIKTLTRNKIYYNHPLRHLLFIRFLFKSAEDFFKYNRNIEIQNFKPFGYGPWPCYNHFADHYKQKVIREYKLSSNSKPNRSIGVFQCCLCGYKYSMVESNYNNKNKKILTIEYGQEWDLKLMQYLCENKYSATKLAKIMHCTKNAIIMHAIKLGLAENLNCNIQEYKIKYIKLQEKELLRSEREIKYKKLILEYIKTNPDTYKQEIRVKFYKQFKWLKDHNKEWLNENVPLKEKSKKYGHFKTYKINWAKRDKELAVIIQKAINNIKSVPNYERISISLICKEIKNNNIYRQLDKLPISKEIIEKNLESIEQRQKRRIQYIINNLISDGGNITKNIIKEKSNLTKNITTEIERYIDDTIKELNNNHKNLRKIPT